jgi:O-antigen/teichoic acid export membrane protein
LTESPGRPLGIGAAVLARRARWHRQASLTTAVGVGARVLGIAVRLITIPLALRLLGPERYGLWLAVGSVLAWVGFLGPGLGHGLINAISDASGRDDPAAIRRHVSTAVFTIGAVGALLLLASPLLSAWPGLVPMLGVEHRPDLIKEAITLTMVAAVLFAAAFSLEFITPVCMGLQEGYLTSVAAMVTSLLMLAGVSALAWQGGTLIAFAAVVGLPPIIANLGLTAYLFLYRHPHLRPSWRLWNRESFHTIMGFGSWMFLMQVGDLGIFQSANILIANRFGPGEVPRYAVPAAVFMNVANLCFLIVQPYWPAMKEASVRHDWDFIRTTMSRTLWIRLAIMTAAATMIVIGGPAFVRLWAGDQTVPTRTLLLAMSVYYLLVAWSGNYLVLLLSLGLVKQKALLTLVIGAASVGGFFLLTPYFGLSAMPIGGALGVLADCLIASRITARYMRKQST